MCRSYFKNNSVQNNSSLDFIHKKHIAFHEPQEAVTLNRYSSAKNCLQWYPNRGFSFCGTTGGHNRENYWWAKITFIGMEIRGFGSTKFIFDITSSVTHTSGVSRGITVLIIVIHQKLFSVVSQWGFLEPLNLCLLLFCGNSCPCGAKIYIQWYQKLFLFLFWMVALVSNFNF